MHSAYRDKVSQLIEVLPYVAEETDLALHGGTAINLFVREIPGTWNFCEAMTK
jgi:hypothetical protein